MEVVVELAGAPEPDNLDDGEAATFRKNVADEALDIL
jgi:hypothetical protein